MEHRQLMLLRMWRPFRHQIDSVWMARFGSKLRDWGTGHAILFGDFVRSAGWQAGYAAKLPIFCTESRYNVLLFLPAVHA